MEIITGNVGWIEVICGPMFSGKSEELIRRLRRAMIARKRVQVFKPIIDKRYSDDEIVSHGDLRMKSEVVADAAEIPDRIDWRSEVIGIDEANFMGPQLVDVAQRLADSGKQVIISRPGYRLPGPPVRADPGPAGAGRDHHQDAGHLRALRQSGQAHATPARVRRPDRGGRLRYVRGALPPLFRARHPEADRAGIRESQTSEKRTPERSYQLNRRPNCSRR